MSLRTAAMLVIGNEVLTGKVREANVARFASLCFSLGIRLRRVVVCEDDVDTIADEVNALRASHDIVVTSGGIGPTHDDMTYEAVAKAFGRKLIRSKPLEDALIAYHDERGLVATEAQKRMADLVEGARLLTAQKMRWPTMVVENVYVLPGVPKMFEYKLTLLEKDLDKGDKLHSVKVYTTCREGEIADLMERLDREYPGVEVGSYLALDHPRYRVKVTFDSADMEAAEAAAAAFEATVFQQVVGRDVDESLG